MPIGFHTDTDDLIYDLDLPPIGGLHGFEDDEDIEYPPMGGLHGEDEEDYDERD